MNKTRIKNNRIVFSIVIFFLTLTTVSAQSFTPNPNTAAKINEYLNAAVRVNGFSGSVLVAQNGQPIISKGYGMANYELDAPNTPQTVFRLGSITKSFTATAIMQLQERGKLSAGDSICKFLSDCPQMWQAITIKNLLTHTSGIADYTNFPDYTKTMSLAATHNELVGRFKNKPLEFAPGEKSNYSSSGYYLLGLIIESASGKAYEEFLRENIFVPLEMRNTGCDSNRRVIKNRANGYTMQGGSLVNASYVEMSVPYAAGAMYSTVEDLLRFDQALYTEKILSRKSLDEMFTVFKDKYGYGWETYLELNRRKIEKGGVINGFTANLSRFPDERVTIILLGNNQSAHVRQPALDLTAIVFGAPYKIPQERKVVAVDRKIFEKYVGQYQPPMG